MSPARTAPVVVGVNGSAASLAAVRIAAREASLRQRPLRVVHAFSWPLYDTSAEGRPYDLLRQQAGDILDRALVAAGAAEGGVHVTGQLIDGLPAAALLRETRTAALLVVGDDGLGTAVCLPVDSVLVQLVARGRCPVMIASGRPRTTGPVLVGVDGSAAARLAVEFGFDEAARRHAPLLAVHVWDPDTPGAEEAAEHLLAESVNPWRDKFPEVEVHCRPMPGEPADVLLQGSAAAQLLVMGPRGAGGGFRTLLGHAGQAVLHHVACPVIFVHATTDRPT